MEFQVFSEKLIKHYHTDRNHIVISIRSPKEEPAELPFQEHRIGIVQLVFHDVGDIGLQGQNVNNKAIKFKCFTNKDAQLILLFVEALKRNIELVICQCEAGISRSAGVAGALNKIYNGDDAYFFKHYLPNMLVYRTILEEYYKEGGTDDRS